MVDLAVRCLPLSPPFPFLLSRRGAELRSLPPPPPAHSVPLLVFLTPTSSGDLTFRHLSLAWTSPPSPLELLELMATPQAWLALPSWHGLGGGGGGERGGTSGGGAWYARWLGLLFSYINPLTDAMPAWAMTAVSPHSSFCVRHHYTLLPYHGLRNARQGPS
jgi:hypothetical protein